MKRAGNRAVRPGPRHHHLAGLQGLAEGVQHVPAELGRLVQEQAAAVGQGRRAGADDPAAPADDRRLAGGVVRRAERRRGQQRAAVGQHAGHRMDRGDLQRRRGVQAGQDRSGCRSASMVLPAPGGPSRHRWWPPAAQISAARRAAGLAEHVGQVGRPARPCRRLAGRRAAGSAPPVDHFHPGPPAPPAAGPPRSQPSKPRSVAALSHPDAGHQGGLGGVGRGHGHPAESAGPRPRPPRAARRGPGGAGRPGPSSPRNATPSMDAAGTTPAALRMATAMPTSKPLPRLGRLAGDRPTVIRRCGHCSRLLMTAARIRSLASRSAVSGRPTSSSPGRPFWMSASTLHRMALHADQGDRVGARDRHSGHPPHMLDGASRRPGPPSSPITSTRTSSNSTPWATTQAIASRRSRICLARLTASSGLPYQVPGPGLDLAGDQRAGAPPRRCRAHPRHTASSGQDPHPGLLQVLGGHLLAPPAQHIFVPHAASPPVLTLPGAGTAAGVALARLWTTRRQKRGSVDPAGAALSLPCASIHAGASCGRDTAGASCGRRDQVSGRLSVRARCRSGRATWCPAPRARCGPAPRR